MGVLAISEVVANVTRQEEAGGESGRTEGKHRILRQSRLTHEGVREGTVTVYHRGARPEQQAVTQNSY